MVALSTTATITRDIPVNKNGDNEGSEPHDEDNEREGEDSADKAM